MAKVNEDGTLTLNKLEILMLAGAMGIAKGAMFKDDGQAMIIGKMTFQLAKRAMTNEQFNQFKSSIAETCDSDVLSDGFIDKAGQIMADNMTKTIAGLKIAEIDLSSIKKKYGSER